MTTWRFEEMENGRAVLAPGSRGLRAVVGAGKWESLWRAGVGAGVRAYLRGYHRLEIVGGENLPVAREGGESFVMVANHASHLDAACLLAALPLMRLHRAYCAAAEDYFFRGLPRMALWAGMIKAIPFGREQGMRRSLEACRRLLAEPGNVLILFPEGTRSRTGAMGDFRGGIGMIVAGMNVAVAPCAVQGTFWAWPKGAMMPRPRGVRLVIGEARRYAEFQRSRESVRQIAGDLRGAVQDLLCR